MQGNEKLTLTPKSDKLSYRLDWLDQFRGLIVILFIIADISWRYNGDLASNQPSLTALFLMHGWDFYIPPFNDWPNAITLIDIGQQIFIFMVGFVGCLAYHRNLEKVNKQYALKQFGKRLISLVIIAFLYDGLNWFGFDFSEWELKWVLFEGTFATIVWSSLVAILLLSIFPFKADLRAGIGILIMVLHLFLYAIPDVQNNPFIVWNSLNHIAICIIATSTAEWWMKSGEQPLFKKRILACAVLSFTGCYLINYVQPADHSDATTALALMAIGTSQFIMFIFYSFDREHIRIPMLTEFGRNVLLMVLLVAAQSLWLDLISKDLLYQYRILGLIWVGVLPILLLYLIAYMLDKKKIYLKF